MNDNTRPYIIAQLEAMTNKIANETDSIKTAIETGIANLSGKIDNIDLSSVTDKLDDSTSSIKAVVDANKTSLVDIASKIENINNNMNATSNYVNTLVTRLTATRASNLDLLANSTYGLNAIKTKLDTMNNSVQAGAVKKIIRKKLNTVYTYSSVSIGSNTSMRYFDITIDSVNPNKTMINKLTVTAGDAMSIYAIPELINATTIRVWGDTFSDTIGSAGTVDFTKTPVVLEIIEFN